MADNDCVKCSRTQVEHIRHVFDVVKWKSLGGAVESLAGREDRAGDREQSRHRQGDRQATGGREGNRGRHRTVDSAYRGSPCRQ